MTRIDEQARIEYLMAGLKGKKIGEFEISRTEIRQDSIFKTIYNTLAER